MRVVRTAPVLVALLVALVPVGACGGDDGGPEAEPEPTTTTTTEPAVAPLTGLVDEGGAAATRGPLSVKIDNANVRRRPRQAGLEAADVVYEEPVEGATRFLAVFHSTLPARIGPVRSTRFVDPGIVWPFGGLYVYSGGTPDKVAAIEASPAQTLDETDLVAAGARERDPGLQAPHNLFVLPEALLAWEGVEDRSPPEPLFRYLDAGATFGGDPAGLVVVPTLSRAQYRWDAAAGAWMREALNGGSGAPVPHLTESGAQIAPQNVIVQRIAGVDDASVLVGEGPAWVCSQGRCTAGLWRRAALEARTEWVGADGAEIRLAPGRTWVHLVTSGEPAITP